MKRPLHALAACALLAAGCGLHRPDESAMARAEAPVTAAPPVSKPPPAVSMAAPTKPALPVAGKPELPVASERPPQAAVQPAPASAAKPSNSISGKPVPASAPKPAPTSAPKPVPASAPKPTPESAAKPTVAEKAAPAIAPKPTPAPPALDLRTLEQRVRDTSAIGVLTKLSLKNEIDDLLDRFRAYHEGRGRVALAELRQGFNLLMMKVLALLQDRDPPLANDIATSREAIWGILADKSKFSQAA